MRSYYIGGSNGGKEGQISAQQFPELYDGFFIGWPLGGHVAVTFRGMWDTLWGADLAKQADPACVPVNCPIPRLCRVTCPNVYSYKAALHYKTVYDKCDPVDGLVDGMIDDPTKCKFDALTDLPACTAAEEAAEGVNGVYSINLLYSCPTEGSQRDLCGPPQQQREGMVPGTTGWRRVRDQIRVSWFLCRHS